MVLHLGCDHAGHELKQRLLEYLTAQGMVVKDHGTHGPASVDYPDHARAVAQAVASEPGSLGIVICGSGNGVNITANKQPGIRSALAWNPEIAALARQHNDANVLALPARFIPQEVALQCVDAFLGATFEGGRHAQRVAKIEPGC